MNTLTHEQCAEIVEKIVEQAKEEARTMANIPNRTAAHVPKTEYSPVFDAYALGVLMSKATDWLAQLEELRGEILKLK